MHYEGTVIRPPSEANSIILQVTVGCSHNKCTFCGAYKDVVFRLKDQNVIDEDVSFADRFCKRQNLPLLVEIPDEKREVLRDVMAELEMI